MRKKETFCVDWSDSAVLRNACIYALNYLADSRKSSSVLEHSAKQIEKINDRLEAFIRHRGK